MQRKLDISLKMAAVFKLVYFFNLYVSSVHNHSHDHITQLTEYAPTSEMESAPLHRWGEVRRSTYLEALDKQHNKIQNFKN
jgi:hypothetical protein